MGGIGVGMLQLLSGAERIVIRGSRFARRRRLAAAEATHPHEAIADEHEQAEGKDMSMRAQSGGAACDAGERCRPNSPRGVKRSTATRRLPWSRAGRIARTPPAHHGAQPLVASGSSADAGAAVALLGCCSAWMPHAAAAAASPVGLPTLAIQCNLRERTEDEERINLLLAAVARLALLRRASAERASEKASEKAGLREKCLSFNGSCLFGEIAQQINKTNKFTVLFQT